MGLVGPIRPVPVATSRSCGTNTLGFVSFLVIIGLNAIGLSITAPPNHLDMAPLCVLFGVIVVGLPLCGLPYISDNVLGFLQHG